MAFEKKYKNKTFHWEGSVHHKEEGLSLPGIKSRSALYLCMSPAQFPGRQELADLALVFSNGDQVAAEVSRLKRGLNVSFDATMVEVGKRGRPHVMVLWDLHVIGALSPSRPSAQGESRTGAAAMNSGADAWRQRASAPGHGFASASATQSRIADTTAP
jgi:hypothetical protein